MKTPSLAPIHWRGERLPRLIIGSAQLGMDYSLSPNDSSNTFPPNALGVNKQVSPTDAFSLLETALDSGINAIDTAPIYGDSQKIIGDFISQKSEIAQTSCPNAPIITHIITKVKSDIFDRPLSEATQKIKALCAELCVKQIFILLLHDTAFEIRTDYIAHFKALGLIRYFGVSIYTQEEFDQVVDNDSVEVIQAPCNLFDHRAIAWQRELMRHNKLLLVRSVFLQGLLFRSYHDDETKVYLDKLSVYCDKLECQKGYLLLAFILAILEPTPLIIGLLNASQLRDNLAMMRALLSDNPLAKSGILEEIRADFSQVPQAIYDPTKW